MSKFRQADLFGEASQPAPAESSPPRLREAAKAQAPLGPLEPIEPVKLPAVAAILPPVAPAENSVYTVGELTRRIKGTLERGFGRVLVRGEVSGFRGPNARGHWYFSLKDSEACLDTKVWASTAARLKFQLRDGLSVVAEGSIDLYEPQGRYSLIVQKLEPEGEGALALAFQQLKEKLQAEGLFGDDRLRPPRPIPFLPKRIGVVTSVTGAALRDFLKILYHRHPRLSVLVCDARVQGAGSAADVVRAIERLSRHEVDCIVVTRGGGSVEDLWTFNEESVARAIHACPVPVVSAVGHEVDFTIADFVADYRAPTPSAAAQKLAPVLRDLELGLEVAASRLCRAADRSLLERRHALRGLAGELPDPRRRLGQGRLHLSERTELMRRVLGRKLGELRLRQRALSERVSRQHPASRLQRDRVVLKRLDERLRAAAIAQLGQERRALSAIRLDLERRSPRHLIAQETHRLSSRNAALAAAMRRRFQAASLRFEQAIAKLNGMSPLKVLSRGYSVVFRAEDMSLVRRASQVQAGESIRVRLNPDGCKQLEDCEELVATVTETRGGGSSSGNS